MRSSVSLRPTPRQRIQATLRLGRALRLVWQTAPRWTLVNTALVVVQGAVPLASLYVMKRVLDAVAAGVATPGRPGAVHGLLAWIVTAAAVAVGVRSVGVLQTQPGQVLAELLQAVHFEGEMRQVRLHLHRATGRKAA